MVLQNSNQSWQLFFLFSAIIANLINIYSAQTSEAVTPAKIVTVANTNQTTVEKSEKSENKSFSSLAPSSATIKSSPKMPDSHAAITKTPNEGVNIANITPVRTADTSGSKGSASLVTLTGYQSNWSTGSEQTTSAVLSTTDIRPMGRQYPGVRPSGTDMEPSISDQTDDIIGGSITGSSEIACYPECINDGVCKDGVCECVSGYEGLYCEIDSCVAHPPSIPTMIFEFSSDKTTSGIMSCASGFKPKNEGMIPVECQNGTWVPSAQEILQSNFRCEPHCDSPAANGGVCSAPNEYQCPYPFGGHSCEQRVDVLCPPIDLKFKNGILKELESDQKSVKRMYVQCNDWFAVDEDGTDFVLFSCIEGKWLWQDGTPLDSDSEKAENACQPRCEPPCLNGGTCDEEMTCKCTVGFQGATCEDRICSEPKPEIDLATYKEESGNIYAECQHGTQLGNGLQRTKLLCLESGWAFDQFPEHELPECLERKKVQGLSEQVVNAEVVTLDDVKVATCKQGYHFLSGETSLVLASIGDKWGLPGNRTISKGCTPSCKEKCLNGGFCQLPNTCKCPNGTSGDRCWRQSCDLFPVYGNFHIHLPPSSSSMTISCKESNQRFPNGETSLELRCPKSTYRLPPPYPLQAIVECLELCEGRCQNGGTCLPMGVCSCVPKYTGKYCEEKSVCYEDPPAYNNAVLQLMDDTQYLLTCVPGYKFEEGGIQRKVVCQRGQWIAEGTIHEATDLNCQPECQSNCSSHGLCYYPETCVCFPGFSGKNCEINVFQGCLKPPPNVAHSMMEYNCTHGYFTCNDGYALEDGATFKKFTCTDDDWKIMDCECDERLVECLPLCDPPCENDGVCLAPDTCECGEKYTGKYCQTPKAKDCVNAVTPIPNSYIQISHEGSFAICRKGFEFASGLNRESIWCRKGRWTLASQNKRGFLKACYPICSSPCLNNGKCIAPETCQCVEPFTGSNCQMLRDSLCWNPPPTFPHTSVFYSPMYATLKCSFGYALQWNFQIYNLTCHNGEWIAAPGRNKDVDLPQTLQNSIPKCLPVCDPDCLNGGKCIMPNVCECAEGFSGEICQYKNEILCKEPPAVCSHSSVKFSGNFGLLLCDKGYRLESGYTEAEISCQNRIWRSTDSSSVQVKNMNCEPICEKPCRNGGKCVAPNVCGCTIKYIGQWCQHLKCLEKPPATENSMTEYDNQGIHGFLQCKPGYKLKSGLNKVEFKCLNGKWAYLDTEDPAGSELKCYPTCERPCFNGGYCVAPDECVCGEGFFGTQCQKRYSKTITGDSCKFPYRYRGEWYYGCTSSGYHRPWCATSTNAQNLITAWAVCVADLGIKKVVVTYKGEACVFPFKHRGEEYNGCTRKDKGRPWCATMVDAYGQALSWSYCNTDWGSEVVILTVRGESCELPFTWQGKKYDTCVQDGEQPWCVTATFNGLATKHGYCMADWGVTKVTLTAGGNICIFPFFYKGQEYDSCVMERGESDPTRRMCAVKVDGQGNALTLEQCLQYFDDLSPSALPSLSKLFPRLGRQITEIRTLRKLRCVLPFWYKNRQYTECTYEESDRPWCATHIDENGVMVERDFCPPNWDIPEVNMYSFKSSEPPEDAEEDDMRGKENSAKLKKRDEKEENSKLSQLLTVKGSNCVFPFSYKGVLRFGCVEDGYQRPWCATEVDLDTNEVVKSEHCPPKWKENLCSHIEKRHAKVGGETASHSFDIKAGEEGGEERESLDTICQRNRFSRETSSFSRETPSLSRQILFRDEPAAITRTKKTRSNNKAYLTITGKRNLKKTTKKKNQMSVEHQERNKNGLGRR